MNSAEDHRTIVREAYAAAGRGDWDKFYGYFAEDVEFSDRKSTRLNSSHIQKSRMPSSA